jgi:hypothetical protein
LMGKTCAGVAGVACTWILRTPVLAALTAVARWTLANILSFVIETGANKTGIGMTRIFVLAILSRVARWTLAQVVAVVV